MNLTVEDVLAVKHTATRNMKRLSGKRIRGVSSDSRTVRRGDLYVALKGERFDGNRFTAEAFRRGAAAAVVDSPLGIRAAGRHPVIVVRDGAKAFGEIASIYRSKFRIPVIAVAGSNGKTTTKDLVTAMLKKKYRVLSTSGNMNNHVGVPATLLRLRKDHQIAVVEIGANHFGEVAYLAGVSRPTHGLITNIGREHLEFFRNIAGAARAEGELFGYLRRHGGTAFVNMDDPRLARRREGLPRPVTYGFSRYARDVKASGMKISVDGRAEFRVRGRGRGMFRVRMSIPGKQTVFNAVAAVAVALGFGVPVVKIRSAAERFRPSGKRMEVLKKNGITILNDTYNANPDSVESALETLGMIDARGNKFVVLADMLEMGRHARREHERIGRVIRRAGIGRLMTFGSMARHMRAAAGTGSHFRTKKELSRALHAGVCRGDVVLVKGSRGMKMEEVVDSLVRYLGKAA